MCFDFSIAWKNFHLILNVIKHDIQHLTFLKQNNELKKDTKSADENENDMNDENKDENKDQTNENDKNSKHDSDLFRGMAFIGFKSAKDAESCVGNLLGDFWGNFLERKFFLKFLIYSCNNTPITNPNYNSIIHRYHHRFSPLL